MEKYQEFLLEFLAERSGLDREDIDVNEDIFAEAYIDSLGVFALVATIENEWALSISEEDMLSQDFRTVTGLVQILLAKSAGV